MGLQLGASSFPGTSTVSQGRASSHSGKSLKKSTRQALMAREAISLGSYGHAQRVNFSRFAISRGFRVAIFACRLGSAPARDARASDAPVRVCIWALRPGLEHPALPCRGVAGAGLADSMRRQDCECAGCEIPVARAWGWRTAGSSPSRRQPIRLRSDECTRGVTEGSGTIKGGGGANAVDYFATTFRSR